MTRDAMTTAAVVVFTVLAGAHDSRVNAQVDQDRAAMYFKEAAELCEREAGHLWGVSLCGPMVIADPATRTIVTNRRAPDAPRPAALGFANTAVEWGGERWTALVWPMIPTDQRRRARMMLHELFHRVQPQLGLMTRDRANDHLDTLEGRYWLQLEWRALAKALGASRGERASAVRDALAFRSARHTTFVEAAENERLEEIREGLAQYTGTVGFSQSRADAEADAIVQLTESAASPSFVRTFAYPSGAAYGILLDAENPGWARQVKSDDDLARLLMMKTGLRPSDDPERAAALYGGAELRRAEEQRDREQKARVAELRRRFVDGPVLIVPAAPGSFTTAGVTPIPGVGMVYPNVRVTAEWGNLDAANALRTADRKSIVVPAPPTIDGSVIVGDGWKLTPARGWAVRPASRPGDYQLVREKP